MAKRTVDREGLTGRKAHVTFSDALWAQILDHFSDGKSLKKIGDIEGMPSHETMRRWLRDRPELRDGYQAAKDARAEELAEENLAFAREAAMGVRDPAGVKVMNSYSMWLLGAWKPKVYGNKQSLEHTGSDGAPLAAPTLVIQTYQKPPDEPNAD